MILNGEYITHKAYGRGQIVLHEETCLTVRFDEKGDTRKFMYPSAIGTFLKLDDEMKAREFKGLMDSLATEAALARKDEVERQQAERQAAADYAKKLKKTARKPTKRAVKPVEEELY